MPNDEKIIQVVSYEKYIVALTNNGNLFKRYLVHDKSESFWEPVDLPNLAERPPNRINPKRI
tara:strand:+ start:12374 stop:12559 length:186 start_codon:yes stop_codon:yes gene_type:complete